MDQRYQTEYFKIRYHINVQIEKFTLQIINHLVLNINAKIRRHIFKYRILNSLAQFDLQMKSL